MAVKLAKITLFPDIVAFVTKCYANTESAEEE